MTSIPETEKVSSLSPPKDVFDPTGNRIGIAFSGGGIRSAAFSLGAIQALQEANLMRRVAFLSGVSGGSYMASAYVSTITNSPDNCLPSKAPDSDEPPEPWSAGSPEEAYLVKNLGYLARGLNGRIWLLANAAFGVGMNLLPLLAGSFLVGRIMGYVILPLVYPTYNDAYLAPSRILLVGLCGGIGILLAILLVPIRRLMERSRDQRAVRSHRRLSQFGPYLSLAALVGFSGLILLPVFAIALQNLISFVGPESLDGQRLVLSTRLAANALLIAASLTLGLIAMAILRSGRLKWLAFLVASVSGPLLLLFPCLLAAEGAIVRDWSTERDLPPMIAAGAVMIVFGLFIHNRNYSLHNFYRERLSEAFFLKRSRSSTGSIVTSPISHARRIKLPEPATPPYDSTKLRPPFLLIGAAVNASDTSVGFGSGAGPYLFAPGYCGSPELGWTPTTEVEAPRRGSSDDRVLGSDLTLPSMVAISGAALSPVMGRLTVSSFRFLLALLNVRLGVWVRRPTIEDATSPQSRLRLAASRIDAWLGQFSPYAKARDGWLEPGALYVLREGMGRTSLNSKFVYVTDGGHWENLGLFELVRQKCTHIVVFDATNNLTVPLADLSRCCQLMFSRLGVRVRFRTPDLEVVVGRGESHLPPVAIADIEYPDATTGVLIFARSKLWTEAPFELRSFAELEPRFPHHSTGNQFLTADQFEAYKRLGLEVGVEASARLHERLGSPAGDEAIGEALVRPQPRLFRIS